jgi:hypothetical protein
MNSAAERISNEVGLVQLKVVDERRDVIGHEPEVDRPIDVGGPAVPLQVDGDDLMARGQRGKDGPEHLARPEPAMQQDQRPSRSVRLEVEVDAIDLGILAGALGVGGPIGSRHGDAPRGWCVADADSAFAANSSAGD